MTEELIQKLITEYGRELYSFCSCLTKNQQDAEDLIQETFTVMIEKAPVLDLQGNLKSYLFSVAVNLWKNEKRKRAWRLRILGGETSLEEQEEKTDTVFLSSEETECQPEDAALASERIRCVRKAVDKLSPKLKLPVYLYYMAGLPQEEIAKILQVPAGTVRSRLNAAKKKLREMPEIRKLEGD